MAGQSSMQETLLFDFTLPFPVCNQKNLGDFRGQINLVDNSFYLHFDFENYKVGKEDILDAYEAFTEIKNYLKRECGITSIHALQKIEDETHGKFLEMMGFTLAEQWNLTQPIQQTMNKYTVEF